MIIPDLNLLVYAYVSDSPYHIQARHWWEKCITENELLGIPTLVLNGFIRLLSSRQIVKNPFPVSELLDICDEWLAEQHVLLLEASRNSYHIVRDLMLKNQLPGSLITDVVMAALAIENDGVVHTNDHDFNRIPEVRTVNPLTEL